MKPAALLPALLPELPATVAIPRDRFADSITPDCYACKTVGTCLAPEINEGDWIIASPAVKPQRGDFVVLWPTKEGRLPMVKRLVNPASPLMSLDMVPCVDVEQLNPRKYLTIPRYRIAAMHKVIGWMSAEEYDQSRELTAAAGVEP